MGLVEGCWLLLAVSAKRDWLLLTVSAKRDWVLLAVSVRRYWMLLAVLVRRDWVLLAVSAKRFWLLLTFPTQANQASQKRAVANCGHLRREEGARARWWGARMQASGLIPKLVVVLEGAEASL